jgi:hypothetical protein
MRQPEACEGARIELGLGRPEVGEELVGAELGAWRPLEAFDLARNCHQIAI